jgi:selenide,water dikinase
MPGNTQKNWKTFETKVSGITDDSLVILCDPQTNGGLLITVDPDIKEEFEQVLINEGFRNFVEPIGVMRNKGEKIVVIL